MGKLGFVRRLYPHEDRSYDNLEKLLESGETWYTTTNGLKYKDSNGNEKDIGEPCWKPNDYNRNSKPSKRSEFGCGNGFHTHFNKVKSNYETWNSETPSLCWRNDSGNTYSASESSKDEYMLEHLKTTSGDHKKNSIWYIRAGENNTISEYIKKYSDGYGNGEITSHVHTTNCYPDIKDTCTAISSYEYKENREKEDGADLLVVKDCGTMNYKKELNLPLDIQLKTDVSVYKYIDEVKNQNGTTFSKDKLEIKNGDQVGTIKDTEDYKNKYQAYIRDRSRFKSVNRYSFAYNQTIPGSQEPSKDVNVLQTEDWKKEYPVVIEAGDSITYKIKLKNNSKEAVNITLEDKLPKYIEGDMYIVFTRARSSESKYVTIPDDRTLHTENIPGASKIKEKYYIKMSAEEEIEISVKVKISSAEDSYDTLDPVANTVKITGTYRADVESNNDYYLNDIANDGERQKSSDYYLCKQYNVKVRQGIDKIYRNDGKTIVNSSEYIVDNQEYNVFTRWACGYDDTVKKNNPIYIENGDVVEYIISVDNFANNGSPYYNPNKVTVSLKNILPTNTAEVMSIKGKIGNVGFTNLSDYTGKLEYNASTNMITDFTLENGKAMFLYVKVRINNSKTTTYDYDKLCTNTVRIDKLTNINGKTTTQGPGESAYRWEGVPDKYNTTFGLKNGGPILNNVQRFESTSSDYFRIKEYNVVIDKYISNVSHVESRGGTQTTYNSEGRKSIISENGNGSQDTTKEKPVYVEFGDKVTYQIKIYNTTNDYYYNIVHREDGPYKQPQYVYVDIKDTLPEKYSELTVTGAGVSYTLEDDNKTMKLDNVKVPANGITTITVSLVVEEATKDTVETNTVEIYNPVRNINSYDIINNGKRLSSFDKYQLNDYNAKLDEWIYDYDARMETYNSMHEFIKQEDRIENNGAISKGTYDKNSYSNENPLSLEKYEKILYATKVTNEVSGGEAESNSGSYAKYNTRVRPTDVTITLDKGLTIYTSPLILWCNSDGSLKKLITSNVNMAQNTQDKSISVTYTITDDEIILSPGEYIIYYTPVQVTESNMCLKNLRSHSEITTLTNINRNSGSIVGDTRNAADNHDRIVTTQNISEKTSDEDYVRLKDLIIAGKVWLDTNKDGQNNDNAPKSDITVKLYKVGNNEPISTMKPKENGSYNFGRQPKAINKDEYGNYTENNEYIKYYVEFEYDGVKYKATEVYGGDKDGQSDGMHNLNTKASDESEGGSHWRQGYSDLPGTTSGKTEYMTDSNAYEFDDVRNSFNSNYTTIGFNTAYTSSREPKGLSYSKEGHVSTLNEDSTRAMRARSFIIQNYNMAGNGVQESLDNTNTLFLQPYGGHHNEYPETEYLKFINFGLAEREKVDLSIDADVKSVKTTINGEEMTYKYSWDKNQADSSNGDYGTEKYKNSYKLENAHELKIDKADYNYRYDDYYDDSDVKNYKQEDINDTNELNQKGQNELTGEVTYRLTVRNKKTDEDEPSLDKNNKNVPIEAAINEIAIYYDQNFVSADTIEDILKKQNTVKDKKELDGLFENIVSNSVKITYDGKEVRGKLSLSSNYGAKEPKDKSGYNVFYLTDIQTVDNEPIYLAEGESKNVELTLTVDKAKIDDLERALKINSTDMGLDLIAQISAYTTKYSDNYSHKGLAGKNAGLVDSDSNPGNLGINDNNEDAAIKSVGFYEDDTYRAGIKVLTDENITRTVSGFVWDDARSDQVGKDTNGDGTADSEIQYLGNGEYNKDDTKHLNANTNPNDKGENKDKPISGVKVSLIEVIQTESGKYYEQPAKYTYDVKDVNGNPIHKKGEYITAITGSDGKYTLSNFIPGYYKVRFDYGYNKDDTNNILYNGQDYKSTTYYNENNNNALYYENSQGYVTDNIGASSNFDYFDKVKSALDKVNKSDAQDDEIRRLNVNSYSETMTTAQGKIFSEVDNHKEALTKNTHMYAESAIFYAKPEKVSSSITNIDTKQNVFDQMRLWNIKNLDFGLEYRPESSIVLDKNISTLELVTSDNETLVKLCFKEAENGDRVIDEKKSKGYENVQFLANNGKEEQGFVYINMDTDILEGCTIKVDYEMDTENQSEVDRINKNLDDIKFETGANSYGTKFKVYTSHNASNELDDSLKYTYNANATAAQLLAYQYLDEESYDAYKNSGGKDNGYKYLKKIKKPYNVSVNTNVDNIVDLKGQGYYGMYLGETYYTGKIGTNDKIAELKVDHILDYIDNDFTFDLSENSTKDRVWQTTTSKELKDRKLLDFTKVNKDEQYNLIDKYGIRYDTENRSNLALSVDDNKSGNYWDKDKEEYTNTDRNGNVSLSRFLKTKNAVENKDEPYKDDVNAKNGAQQYTGKINAVATKILSADDVTQGKGLSYNNIAEVVQYTSLTGRRTTLPDGNGNGGVIGNANVSDSWTGYLHSEDDTDATEVITISPPTGLVK